jgi:hypothetical protein
MKRVIGLVVAMVATLGITAPPATSALPDWKTSATSWTNPAARHPLVVNLRYAKHPRFDRVVIRIQGRLPGYRAAYHRHFFHDASGRPVPIRGGLQVVLMPAYAHNQAGGNVYRGPKLVRPGFPALKAIAMTGDFEGQVTFAFGLSPRRTPYRIFRLHDPQRLVIDFRHTP